MKFSVDRRLPVPIAEQIKGQTTYAIACGILKQGDPLPSVRALAATLQVAPVTVSQVYRELSQQGLVTTKPGRGTFVADLTLFVQRDRVQASQKNLRQIVDTCLRQGLLIGHTVDEITSMFAAAAEQYRLESTELRVVMVGNFRPATEAYAQEIENILRDLNVKVVPVLLSDLENPDCIHETIKSARLVITVPTRLERVHNLLKSRHIQVAAVAFRPSPDTRRKLSSVATSRRIGLVATYPEFLPTLAGEVASYCVVKAPPLCAVIEQQQRVRNMLGKIDVLIYASGSEKVLEWLGPDVEAIEFRHAPEPDSVNRLRPLLT